MKIIMGEILLMWVHTMGFIVFYCRLKQIRVITFYVVSPIIILIQNYNISLLKKYFKNINYSIIPQPINNGKEVVISHDTWGHPCFLDINKADNTVLGQKKLISTTIDKLVDALSLKPSFIKIDTEGAEYDVLEGMKETLKKFKPKIMLEKHPTMIPNKILLQEIDKLLKDNNYKSTLISNGYISIREIWE